MCAATTNPPSKSIGLNWTDEELVMLLVRMANGTPFPDDVIEGVNPYQHKPANLPENSWFYICSDQKNNSQHGFWKAKGEPSEILTNSSVTGLRTTLEFYEGCRPHAQRTNWVMQEYCRTQKGLQSNNNLKGSKILCRVFLTSGTIENENQQQKLDCAERTVGSFFLEKPSVGLEIESNLRLSGSQPRSRVDNIGRASDGVKDLSEIDCIARGDYLELDDLVNPGSRSFSSDDSSCLTISSDECFESFVLLKDLEDEINKDKESKSANFSYTVAASAKPNECSDSLALLKDLEDEINKDNRGKSANFSCTVVASAKPNESFNSVALLKDLEDEINKDNGGKSVNCSYTVAASAKPGECFNSLALLKDLEDEINEDNGAKSANFSSAIAASAKRDECFDSLALLKVLEDEINKDNGGKGANFSSAVAVSAKPDECFDSLALLKDLEDKINKDQGGKSSNFEYTVAASAKSNDIVIREVTLGSHVGSGNENRTPNKGVEKRARDKRVAENATESQNMKNGDKKTSTTDSEDETSSSSSHKSASEGEKKRSGRRLKKLKRKYLCFMPFYKQ